MIRAGKRSSVREICFTPNPAVSSPKKSPNIPEVDVTATACPPVPDKTVNGDGHGHMDGRADGAT